MLTQDISQELKDILTQLREEKKEATIALVKARLSRPVPIPALIAAIKSWKQSNRVPKVEIAAQTINDNNKIEKLENQVADLIARVEQLEKQRQRQ
ncbi:hypothetical protein [Vibrio ostreicida]|uniref:hypothetical protein n=1 Tax=Vibrio ostreicida TaxID=526588 RepID=UPI0009702D49|nr:hypothetical protein [Vibrio ostreicida]